MSATVETPTSLLVDGNNILVRAMKAMERSRLSADGVPTGALLVFINALSRYVREVQPTRMVVCWDGGRSLYRQAIYEGYKSNRGSPDNSRNDETERSAFHLAKTFLTLSNIHHIEQHGVEADDLIAAHCLQRDATMGKVIILSGDKDLLQLLDGWVEQIRPGTPDGERWTINRVRTKMKCKPEHLPYVMALTGDPGDGVPGVPGIGSVTACRLLSKYGWDFEALLAANELKLFGYREEIRRNLALVNLRDPLPGIHVEAVPRFEPTDRTSVLWGDLIAFLDRYAMASVKDRVRNNTLWADAQPLLEVAEG